MKVAHYVIRAHGPDCTKYELSEWIIGELQKAGLDRTEDNQVKLCKSTCAAKEGCVGFSYQSLHWCYFKFCDKGWNKDLNGGNFRKVSFLEVTHYIRDS